MNFESKVDQFSGGFVRFTANDIAVMSANALIAGAYDSNRCVVHDALEGTTGGVYVDAGDSVRLAGPAWSVSAPRGTAVAGGLNVYGITLDSKFNGASLPGLPTRAFSSSPASTPSPGPAARWLARSLQNSTSAANSDGPIWPR